MTTRTVVLRPNGNGTVSSNFNATTNFTDSWQYVDEDPYSDADFFGVSGNNGSHGECEKTFACPDQTVKGNITNVSIYVRAKGQYGYACTSKTLIYVNGAKTYGTAHSHSNDPNAYVPISTSYNNNPVTSVAWTWNDINGLELGWYGYAATNVGIYCSHIYAVVTYETHPPNTPSTPSGPSPLVTGTSGTYSTSATDPDGDNVYYVFGWGDGTGWFSTGWYASGQTGSLSHTYASAGSYSIIVKAVDTSGEESGWATLNITVNRIPNNPSTPSGPTTLAPGTAYNFSSTASDPDGQNITYRFVWGDGNWNDIQCASGTTGTLSHTYSGPGTYGIYVGVYDTMGAWAANLSGTLYVTVNRPPNPPSTPSGSTSLVVGTSYNFSSTASDPDGQNITYRFAWGDGNYNDTGWYASGAAGTLSHTFGSAGTYGIYVGVYDTMWAWGSNSGTLTVSVHGTPSTPSTPSGTTACTIGTSYAYTTSATDPGGHNLYYVYDWGDGTSWTATGWYTSGATATASHTFTTHGVYSVHVYATNDLVTSAWSSTLSILANTAPATPSVPSGASVSLPTQSQSFSTSGTDPNGDQVRYTFNWGDGTADSVTGWVNSGVSASASHSWATVGTYSVKAKSEDAHNWFSGWSSTVSIVVNNYPATPSIPSGSATGTPGVLSGEYSTAGTDPNGDQVKYWINWGDGTQNATSLVNSGVTAHLHHTWTAGVYNVIALTEDSKGWQSGWSAAVIVTVNTAPGTPSTPTGTIAGVPAVSYNYTSVATDADGQNIQYTWEWDEGGATQNSEWLTSGSNCTLSHTFAAPGTYHVKAKVTDSLGAVSSYSSTLTVVIYAVPGTPSTPAGTSLGKPTVSYNYTTAATDPGASALTYTFEWGDGTAQTVVGPFASGATTDPVAHTFTTFGTYSVKVYASNAQVNSAWSPIRTVVMSGGTSRGRLVGI